MLSAENFFFLYPSVYCLFISSLHLVLTFHSLIRRFFTKRISRGTDVHFQQDNFLNCKRLMKSRAETCRLLLAELNSLQHFYLRRKGFQQIIQFRDHYLRNFVLMAGTWQISLVNARDVQSQWGVRLCEKTRFSIECKSTQSSV